MNLGRRVVHAPGAGQSAWEDIGTFARGGREAVSLGDPYPRGTVILVEGAPCPGERESASGTWRHQVQGTAFPPWGATLGG